MSKTSANRLRVLRAEKRLSQMATADAANIHINRFWRIENCYSEATLEEKVAIARALGVAASDAFPEAIRRSA